MIDINSDMGELTHLFEDGTYHRLIDHVTSINLACGGHAGNTIMMTELSKLAKIKNVYFFDIMPKSYALYVLV